jgi:hypothetical protein
VVFGHGFDATAGFRQLTAPLKFVDFRLPAHSRNLIFII